MQVDEFVAVERGIGTSRNEYAGVADRNIDTKCSRVPKRATVRLLMVRVDVVTAATATRRSRYRCQWDCQHTAFGFLVLCDPFLACGCSAL
jgi:hypothetical protein